MKMPVICNDPPYGTERSCSGLRLAGALAQREGDEVRVFLVGDPAGCAVAGQMLPDGYYHPDRMLDCAIRRGVDMGRCGTCMDARGIGETALVEGAHRSSAQDLTDWTLWADLTLTL